MFLVNLKNGEKSSKTRKHLTDIGKKINKRNSIKNRHCDEVMDEKMDGWTEKWMNGQVTFRVTGHVSKKDCHHHWF